MPIILNQGKNSQNYFMILTMGLLSVSPVMQLFQVLVDIIQKKQGRN